MKGKRVVVGLSGGVDSGVSAALLKEQGAEVIGVFVKGWYPPGMPCSWREDRKDAMRVAARLQIPFTTLDASEEYRRGVIEYLLAEYKAGRTPNPDVMCNREVKFGALWQFAKSLGADYLATGHYARSSGGKLFRGVDREKDQSYFLWAVPKEVLARVVFPLGEQKKSETRMLAKRYRLPVAEKRDSQGICFLGSISVEDFLRNEFGSSEGRALDMDGNVVGKHSGALLHTIGERVSLTDAAAGPWYVVRKDIKKNELMVAHEVPQGGKMGITLTQTNWLRSPGDEVVFAQYRYHGPVIEGSIKNTIIFPKHELPEPLSSGQSLVIYEGDECLGGGIMQSA